MMNQLAALVIVALALFLIAVAGAIFFRPPLARRFLNSFASSARAHYTEQAIRLLVGAALLVRASTMWQPDLFRLLGWLIVATSVGLLCIPWTWHHRFARIVIPPVIRHMKLYAVALIAFAGLLFYGLLAGGSGALP